MPKKQKLEEDIRQRLPLRPVPLVPEILLHQAQPESRLRQMIGDRDEPYWAYPWAGGSALARFLVDRPELVQGARLLDIGCGSGLVSIAAARAGASSVVGADIDYLALAATRLNAAANGVYVDTILGDLLDDDLPQVDVITMGDLFYEKALAVRAMNYMRRCNAQGIRTFIGDPFRAHLPQNLLLPLARYQIKDFGQSAGETASGAGVFTLLPE